MDDALPSRVRIGAFEVDLRAGELREGEHNVCLQEQPLFVLRMLVARPGEIVTREEIKQKLWPNDTVVDFDQGVNAAVRKLRIAFGDSADEPKYLGTIARRGYRLLAPVQPIAVEQAATPVSGVGSGAAVRQQKEEAGLVGKKVSHYRVLKVIGGGGMGLVYEAEDLKLGRRVALKFLPDELAWDPTALQRFEREARAASLLDHPNICTIYEVEEHDGEPFIVMQLLAGKTLRQHLNALSAAGATMNMPELLDISVQICQGLQAAHDKGIIHRDIKPPNIFLTTAGQVKILDFGLAKLAHAIKEGGSDGVRLTSAHAGAGSITINDITLTGVGAAMGTAGYMSPEQIQGEKLDSRTDIFSFGCVLYEMAAGKRAFQADTSTAVQDAIMKQNPIPVRECNPGLPPAFEAIVDRAIEKDRAHRYQTAAEMRWALEDLLDREKAAEAAPEPPRRWSRWLASAVVCVALIAGAVYWRAQKAPKLAYQDTIVIADFDNKTGNAVFDDTLKQALTIQIEQSPFLHVLSSDKTADTLKLMNRKAGDRLPQEVAHEVCVRSNSQALLAGSIASIGDQYLIGLRATNCQTGETLASAEATADNRNHVLQTLSNIANELREKLGESGASVKKFNQPLEQVTTSSLDALQAYTEGRKAEDTSSLETALRYYKRAVELDPNFAIAYGALSETYGVLYDGANQSRYLTKAYELRDRVSLRERYSIEAGYYNSTDEVEKEVGTLTGWIHSYPDDYQPHNQLSAIYLTLGQYEKAL